VYVKTRRFSNYKVRLFVISCPLFIRMESQRELNSAQGAPHEIRRHALIKISSEERWPTSREAPVINLKTNEHHSSSARPRIHSTAAARAVLARKLQSNTDPKVS